MAFQGNLIDTTPLKANTAHGGDDLSLSELDTTPQFRWMGEGPPATPGSEPEEEIAQDSSLQLQDEQSQTRDLDVSFDQTLRFEQSALEDGDAEETERIPPTNNSNEVQELENLKYTLKTMNKSILQLNSVLKACIPKFERMQNAIETWDGLSKQYNQIMIETERTAQVLEDTSWPGRVKEEVNHQQGLIEEEQRRLEEEAQHELELQREEERRLEKARVEQEKLAKQQQPPARGRGRGRGTGVPARGMAASETSGSRIPSRGSGIGRGISASASSRPSRGSIATRGRFS